MPTASARRLLALLAGHCLLAACEADRGARPEPFIDDPAFVALADVEWSPPVHLATVSSPVNEQNAFLSKDELSLYFSSVRPGGLGNLDIWVAHRESPESEWGTPVNLGAPINTERNDFAPNLSIDGHLLFYSTGRAGSIGLADIWMSRRTDPTDDFSWDEPVLLVGSINTALNENAPFYLQSAEDGTGNLYFNRGPVGALHDIYVAPITREGVQRGPEMLVAGLSSPDHEAAVSIRRDGREVFFWSTRPGTGSSDMWTSVRQSVHEPWGTPENLGPVMNSAVSDVTPHLSFDGRTLIFGSDRPGGIGGHDLWMSRRTSSRRP